MTGVYHKTIVPVRIVNIIHTDMYGATVRAPDWPYSNVWPIKSFIHIPYIIVSYLFWAWNGQGGEYPVQV